MRLSAVLALCNAVEAAPRLLQEGPVTPNNVRSHRAQTTFVLVWPLCFCWYPVHLLNYKRLCGRVRMAGWYRDRWGTPGGPSDCAMRKLAYTYGKQLRPDQAEFPRCMRRST